MYLKSLQVIGFKSFADRTVLEFHPGVTAIVGPNGCGKSNVLDAIRWVLGEQSAKALRGSEMKDVIFSGTDKRKALSMAEVSLTFGECEKDLGVDYNEVTITRRVFRDGASDYELNKTPCRLRDIQQLFMNTGIGRTAYSIMEQGKIDQILSSHPEDRRAIFEEAAGITKYKAQKKEALRKLEHTEANLVRLADIIREVKRQIGSLQRQAGKARRYREGRDVLCKLESKLARRQFDQFQTEISQLQEEVDSGRQNQSKLDDELQKQENALQTGRQKLQSVEEALGALRDDQNESRNAIERLAQHRATNEGRVTEFTELAENCRREVAGTEEKIRAQEEQLEHLTKQLEQSGAKRNIREVAVARLEEQAAALEEQVASIESERVTHRKTVAEIERAIESAQGRLSALELQDKNFVFQVENLRRNQAELDQKREAAQLRAAGLANELKTADEKLAAHRQQLQIARETEMNESAAVHEAEAATTEAVKKLQSFQARRDALAQLESTHAGAPATAQEILAVSKNQKLQVSVQGTLADHFKVKPGYEKAVALLLGEAVNALIVEDREAVETIARHLRGGRSGRCVLGVLDYPRFVASDPDDPAHASHFIEADAIVGPLMRSLLGESYIVSDLAAAWEMRNRKPRALVVTSTGERLTRFGLVHFGTQEGASLAVLSRGAEIRQLDADIERLDSEWKNARTIEDEKAGGFQRAEGETRQIQARMQEAEIQSAAQRQAEQAVQRELDEIGARQESLTREINELSGRNRCGHEQREAIQKELEQQKQKLAAQEKAAEAIEQRFGKLVEEQEELDGRLTAEKIGLATESQQCESWRQQIAPVKQRVAELRELMDKRRLEAGDYEKRIVLAREEIIQAETGGVEHREKLEAVTLQIDDKQRVKAGQLKEIEKQEAILRQARKMLNEMQTARSAQEVRLTEQKMLLQNLRDRMRHDYQLELEALPAIDAAEKLDWAAIETEAAGKRQALEAMGPVNLDAITEYDDLEQRHKFLDEQQKDMVKAKEQLHSTIGHINHTTRKLFAETFEQIKAHFQEMFVELFGGGKATLVLQDESDPLECGIDIVARPPGKQLQGILLLSGGERTMTAVALLFAIYMVKPSPFCVLDELDAPLDESNINRFVKILKRFVAQSQFVVITHNKRTISMSDILYGVTMEERGVSKFVSVRLSGRERGAASTTDEQREIDEPMDHLAEAAA